MQPIYDSYGIGILSDSKLIVKKEVGKIGEITNVPQFVNVKGNIAIGHTRWSTHGGVTKENAHPHLDCSNKIAVAHNGIIENFQELKEELIKKGHVFKSDTDTEIIPHLIEEYSKELEFHEAVGKAISKLEGSYALAIVSADRNEIIAARKETPLVVGIGDKEYFVASDIPAFLEHTKKVIYLHEHDIAILNNGIKIYNLKENNEVFRPIDTVEWDAEQAEKGEFDHFMLKEIAEQADVVKKAIRQDPKIIYGIADMIKKAKGVYFVGCGTAFHASLLGSYMFSKISKRHVNVALGSEFPNYKDFLVPESLVIAVSQSGETADTLAAIRAAKAKEAKVISIVNAIGSSLARESDYALLQNAGPEICVLSTKSYTSQLAILTLLAYALADKFDEGRAKLNDLINYIYYLTSVNMRDRIRQLAERLKDAEHIFCIGRSLQYPTALEAALKIKEVSYIHTEAFAGGELKHGTIALIEKGTPCIVFASADTEREIISNALELKARGGYVIGIGPKNNEAFDFFIKVREAEEANSICQIIPIQILAYQLALLRGCDPDRPRNLAKAVTVK